MLVINKMQQLCIYKRKMRLLQVKHCIKLLTHSFHNKDNLLYYYVRVFKKETRNKKGNNN